MRNKLIKLYPKIDSIINELWPKKAEIALFRLHGDENQQFTGA